MTLYIIIMSKLNNLIGFWNSKSAEQEDKRAFSQKPSRPKSEIIDSSVMLMVESKGQEEVNRYKERQKAYQEWYDK